MTIETDLSSDGAMALLAGVSSEAPDAVDDENAVIDNDEEENEDNADGDDADASTDEDNVDAESSDADDEGEVDPDGATDDAENEGDEAEQSKTAIEPPVGLDETEREAFKKLPKEAQEILARQSKLVSATLTQKTQALAADRKELQSRIAALREVKTEKQKRIEKWGKVDWADLANKLDPKEWNRQKALMEKEVGEYRSIESSLKQQDDRDFRAHAESRVTELQKLAPHLAGTDEKAVAARIEIADLAVKAGYDREALKWMSAFEMHSLWKAQQWDKYQAEKAKKPNITAKKDEKQAGRNIKPTSRTNAPTGLKGVAQKKFKAKPTQQGAMALLNSMDID
jgi:hypothetical protein